MAKQQAIPGKEYVVDWPGVYMLPSRVTMDSASRNFQYHVLNNIVYFNEQMFKMNLSDNPYCSFCKSSYENVIMCLVNAMLLKKSGVNLENGSLQC